VSLEKADPFRAEFQSGAQPPLQNLSISLFIAKERSCSFCGINYRLASDTTGNWGHEMLAIDEQIASMNSANFIETK
jgi:hypothetical protein